MSFKALMVDVDGVVVIRPDGTRWDHGLQADLGISPEALQAGFFAPHWPDVVHGRADLHERLGLALAQIAPDVSAEALAKYWFAKDAVLDHRLLADLAAAARTGLQLHLATVQEHRRVRYLMEDLKLGETFQAIHYSADYGLSKPDPAFFDAVAARTGFAPQNLLLIDDSARNVEAALGCGWRAVLWDGSRSLTEVLAGSEAA